MEGAHTCASGTNQVPFSVGSASPIKALDQVQDSHRRANSHVPEPWLVQCAGQ